MRSTSADFACLALIGMLALTACGEASSDREADRNDVSDGAPSPSDAADDRVAPGIAPTAAPGVAFSYQYSFRLPAARIAEAQEAHAAACERLTVQRCRIIGMRYRLVGEKDVTAMLAFRLDPAIARQFGKDGIAGIARSEGMLVDSEISGVDAAAAIAGSARETARITTMRQRIDADLARNALTADQRASLIGERDRLDDARTAAETESERQAAALAMTPMQFTYGSGDLVPGFDARTPLRDAFATSGRMVVGTLAILIVIVSTLGPWALILILAWLGWRAVRPRITRWRATPPAADVA